MSSLRKVDASYESSRVDGKIIDIACLAALGADSEGHRHVLGMDPGQRPAIPGDGLSVD